MKKSRSPKEPTVVYSADVKKKLKNAPPKVQEAMRNLASCMRQAMQGVNEGKYKSFADAMEILTGSRPKPLEIDDDDSKDLP